MSTLNEIKKLIKIANDYDTLGDHKSADKVDTLIASAFNKLAEDKVSGIVTGPETTVEGDPNAKLEKLKTGDAKTDKFFSKLDFEDASQTEDKDVITGFKLAPETKKKIVETVEEKKRKKGGPLSDAEIEAALKELEGLDVEGVLGKDPKFIKKVKHTVEKSDKATAQVPRTQTDVTNLAQSIKGKSIGWATVDDITLSGDKVTSVSLTLQGGKKVKYTPKTQTKAGKSALALTVGDINKKLNKKLKV